MKKMMLLLWFGVITASAGLLAAPIVIKVASMTPQSTSWGKMLDRMAKEWSDATGGEVKMIIYHNGVLGSDESEVLKKLKTNQIQGAVFTSIGMNSITKSVFTLSCPFLIRTDAEMEYVLKNMGGDLEKNIENAGYQMVAWSRIGWIRFFSRHPVTVPADLKKQRLADPEDMPELSNMFKTLGYTVVHSSINDIHIALSSNKLDAIFQIPPFVAAMQVFKTTKNMLELDISPVMGGIVMNQATWRRISDKHKPKILEIARKIAAENDTAGQKLSADAIKVMKDNGLAVNSITPAQEKLWVDEAAAAMPNLIGSRNSVLDPEIYRRVEALLKTYRGR